MKITTEHIYFGGYAIVISVSLLTVYFAKKAARTKDLEEAKKKLDSHNAAAGPDAPKSSEEAQDSLEGSKDDE